MLTPMGSGPLQKLLVFLLAGLLCAVWLATTAEASTEAGDAHGSTHVEASASDAQHGSADEAAHAEGDAGHHGLHLDGSKVGILWCIPFVGILLSIAILPLATPHLWGIIEMKNSQLSACTMHH